MSLNFTNIIKEIEAECGFNSGDISGDSILLADFTRKINMAHGELLDIGFKNSGRWELDDNSQYETDGSTEREYPIIYTNIVSGRSDYQFLTDEQGNLILDIYKVLILPSATATIYQEIEPVDEESSDNISIIDESNPAGVPSAYGKRSNAIFFNAQFNYNATRGIKLLINREGVEFQTTDTTKKPGVPGNLHYWYVFRPSQSYIRINGTNDAYTKVTNEVMKYERKIKETFSMRERDVRHIMGPKKINYI